MPKCDGPFAVVYKVLCHIGLLFNGCKPNILFISISFAEFAQQMAAAHEQFAKEVQAVIGTFRRKNNEFQFERPVDSPSSIQKAWESLLHETEMDAQAHLDATSLNVKKDLTLTCLSIGTPECYKPQCTPGCYKPQCEVRPQLLTSLSIGTPGCYKPQCEAHLDAASLLINNVYKPLEEVAIHKQSQAHKLNNFRDKFEEMLQKVENQIDNAEKDYIVAYNQYEDCHINKSMLYNAHNEYIFQLRASNRSIDQFQIAIPQVLEIYIKSERERQKKLWASKKYRPIADSHSTGFRGINIYIKSERERQKKLRASKKYRPIADSHSTGFRGINIYIKSERERQKKLRASKKYRPIADSHSTGFRGINIYIKSERERQKKLWASKKYRPIADSHSTGFGGINIYIKKRERDRKSYGLPRSIDQLQIAIPQDLELFRYIYKVREKKLWASKKYRPISDSHSTGFRGINIYIKVRERDRKSYGLPRSIDQFQIAIPQDLEIAIPQDLELFRYIYKVREKKLWASKKYRPISDSHSTGFRGINIYIKSERERQKKLWASKKYRPISDSHSTGFRGINIYIKVRERDRKSYGLPRSIDQLQIAIPQDLELFRYIYKELEEIYIDTSNTINVAIESHALLLLTKANEQHRRFEDLLQICRQVNPQLDISYFVNALNPECAKFELKHHKFHPVDSSENEVSVIPISFPPQPWKLSTS
ncbi:unnamed protein product [Mytilus edulis]|uniref:Uncharacterized protein n=1 Tax=Mytilus edulis TaxID=6550 RepID=A0A8S3UKA4_MYTED|nr:unnamed protein product [Mytilus edulis]